MTRAVLFTDGGARGNPGPAGAGFVISAEDRIVCEGGTFLGDTTNNVAEYEALIWGLENVVALGYDEVKVCADSELVVKQVTGAYRVKQAHLKPLAQRATVLLSSFRSATIQHVRRELNKEADALVNSAIDTRSTVGEPACGYGPDAAQATLF